MKVNLAAAHPLTDEDGTVYNVGASIFSMSGLGMKYHIVKIPPAKGKGMRWIP